MLPWTGFDLQQNSGMLELKHTAFQPRLFPCPPSASLHRVCMRARLADGGCSPGWPLPASSITPLPEGSW